MLIYLSIPKNRETEGGYIDDEECKRKLVSIGHTVIMSTYGDNGDRETIIARCDAAVYLPNWYNDARCLQDLTYAKTQGLITYGWHNLPALHPTEVVCPIQSVEFLTTVMRMYRMHLDKNADYSPANILGTGMLGLTTRLWDKLVRFMSLYGYPISIKHYRYGMKIIFLNKRKKLKEPKNEPIEDTLLDMAAYSIIALLLQKGKWGK